MFRCKILKYLRVAVSLAVLAWFGLFFTSFWPRSTAAAKGEFLPALLHSFHHPAVLAVAAAAGILVLTWLFGRFYCSFCCPLGVLQDIAGRLGRILSFGKLRYRCSRNWRRFRYLFAIALFALAAGGLVIPIGFFDPFTLFGRNANSLGQPALVELFNYLYTECNWESVMPMEPKPPVPLGVWLPPALFLIAILAAAFWRGRIFCNLLCPVGALLGAVSRKARFPLSLSPDICVRCGKCAKVCKAGCIDVRNGKLDFERCVLCMNCLNACNFGAIRFGCRPSGPGSSESIPAAEETNGKKSESTPEKVDTSRRGFLLTAGAVAAGGALLGAGARKAAFSPSETGAGTPPPVMPPGAGNREEFFSRCTGCQLCVANCIGRTLKPARFEYGLGGIGQPRLSFENGRCEFNCHACSSVCPTGALKDIGLAAKQRCRIGTVHYFRERCVVVTNHSSCGACAEHCPTGALQMVSYEGHLTIPKVIPELCIGCGSCEYICPVLPVKAVVIYGSRVQDVAADPAEVLRKPETPAAENTGELEEFPF